MKFKDRFYNLEESPVLIVGEQPGRRQDGNDTGVVWEGNRSAKLLNWALEGLDNYYLTNIVNYQDWTQKHLNEGIKDLYNVIETIKPRVILCVGAVPYAYVSRMKHTIPVMKLYHPSYIARFNRDKEEWRREIKSVFTNEAFDV